MEGGREDGEEGEGPVVHPNMNLEHGLMYATASHARVPGDGDGVFRTPRSRDWAEVTVTKCVLPIGKQFK